MKLQLMKNSNGVLSTELVGVDDDMQTFSYAYKFTTNQAGFLVRRYDVFDAVSADCLWSTVRACRHSSLVAPEDCRPACTYDVYATSSIPFFYTRWLSSLHHPLLLPHGALSYIAFISFSCRTNANPRLPGWITTTYRNGRPPVRTSRSSGSRWSKTNFCLAVRTF